ncbi:MAG: tol-pal system protein YbgF [Pseudomonadota bacterium]
MRHRLTAWLWSALLVTGTATAEPPERRGGDRETTPAAVASSRETVVDLLLQVDRLQTELRQLRGQVETQGHEIERLKAKNRDLTADIDRRLRELEQARGGTGAAAPAGRPAVSTAEEQKDYDRAFALLKQGQYERAAKALQAFLVKYPNGALAANARYWLGESHYVIKNFREALADFRRVLKDHPDSDKAPDAQLKIGYVHIELGEPDKARLALADVVKRYPNTRAARSAEERLAQLKKPEKAKAAR